MSCRQFYVLVLLCSALLTVGCLKEQPLNVLLVTFDTTRADHIGCYGKGDGLTPHVDGLAAEGVRFAKAYSAVPLTTPSHATILTGKYPFSHGVRDNGQFVLPEQQETLAEILKGAGYRTAAAIGAFPLTKRFGTDQGFDLYDDKVERTVTALLGEQEVPKQRLFFDERRAGRVNEALAPWIEANRDEPFFVWAHYFDPHQPFQPPAPYDQLYTHDRYLGEIAYADENFGKLLDLLRKLEVYDRTLIIFASDHGEGRGEHNELTHSLQVYDTTVHVPLIIKAPGMPAGLTVEAPVATVDILPTVLDILDIALPEDVQGRSLQSVMNGESDVDPPNIYAETLSPRLGFQWGELRALIKGNLKYIYGPRPELYDVVADPHELHNLVISHAEIADRMQAELADFLSANATEGVNATVAVDEKARQQLMALGYLSGSGGESSKIEEVLRPGGIAPQDRVRDVSDFSKAKNLLSENRPLPAREVIQGLVDKDPKNPAYLELLATAYTQMGQLDKALAILEETVAGGRISGRVLFQIGSLYFLRHEYDSAQKTLRRGVELEDNPTGHYLLANIYAVQDDRQAEFEALRAALQADPGYAPARIDLAIRLAQSGDRDAAEGEFARAIRDEPYFAKAFFNYGAFLAEDGYLTEACRQLDRAVELRPAYWRAYVALIQIHLAMNNRDEALRHLEILVSRAPDLAETEQAKRLLGVNS
ncbi:MAG: sulfatase-like hydrolase/transferase [bacterium]|nr:sulfatase-like hydrolase/transferase [bacterium]